MSHTLEAIAVLVMLAGFVLFNSTRTLPVGVVLVAAVGGTRWSCRGSSTPSSPPTEGPSSGAPQPTTGGSTAHTIGQKYITYGSLLDEKSAG